MKAIFNDNVGYIIIIIMINVITSIILQTTKTESDAMIVSPICFGEPLQCFNLIFETGIAFVIIGKSNYPNYGFTKRYNKTLSIASRTPRPLFFTIPYNFGNIHGLESIDSLSMNNILHSINSFSFLLEFDSTIKYDIEGILGLSRHYPNKIDADNGFNTKFSLIHSFYENKIIDKKIFMHKYINDSNGLLYLGEVPHDNTQYFKCKGKDDGEFLYKWYCPMYSITLSENISPKLDMLNKEFDFFNVVFNTGGMDIKLPLLKGTSDALFELLLSLNNELCYIIEEGKYDEYKKFMCSTDININIYPDIYFNLDNNYKLVLHHRDLFVRKKSSFYECVIMIDKKLDHIEIGAKVLKNYNMIFDYDDNSISFHYCNDDNSHDSIVKQNSRNSIICFLINIIVLLSVIGIVCDLFLIKK